MWRFLVAFRKTLWNFPRQAAVGYTRYTCVEKTAGALTTWRSAPPWKLRESSLVV